MADEKKDGESKVPAKTISKIFKFVAAIGIIVCAVLKWVGVMPGATIGEICAVWTCVYGLGAGTIDANLIIDKFRGDTSGLNTQEGE